VPTEDDRKRLLVAYERIADARRLIRVRR
jgi:hypothetical protein